MSADGVGSPDRTGSITPITGWTFGWALLAGLVLGMIGAFLQAATFEVGPVTIPVWAILVMLTLLVSIRAITVSYGSRKPGSVFFLGWLIASIVLALPLPSGDQVIADGAVQVFYFFGGVVLGSTFVSLPAALGARGPSKEETNAAIRGNSNA
ncbi:MAG: hypothetical protein K0U64_12585 [Actinomycetia bacterium]|nr:hypothetical protein [Actinomycetes bacterium]